MNAHYLLRAISAALFLSANFALPAAAAPTYELARSPRARRIDVKHVAIDLRFDWEKRKARGRTTITLAPLSATRTVNLDAGMLTINAITLASGTPLSFRYDGKDSDDGLVIELDRVYPARQDLTIAIAYETNWVNDADPNNLGGSDGKGLRFFTPTSTEPIKRRQVWSGGVPEANRYWFPSYDAPDDLRTTEFTATVATPLMAISNGKLEATTNNPDGTRTFRWRMNTPYANHLTSFVVGEYTDIKQDFQGIPLHSFGYTDESEAVAASVVRLPDMARYFSDVTGVRYPYDSYSQVFVQDHGWGFASTNMSTLTENMIDDAPTHADYFYLWDGLEAEALAQQWFGSYLSIRDWSHAWLNRGFAHYFDQLYTEHKNGRADFLLWNHAADLNTYMGDWKSGNRRAIVQPNDERAIANASDNYPYVRGALVLHMLRKHLGEDIWAKAVKHYVATNGGKTVSTEDFRRAVEEASGESMGWFFEQWLYSAGHPVFHVSKQYDDAKKLLVLTVKQTQQRDSTATYPQVSFFAGKVDIELDGAIEQVWLAPRAENTFTFSLAKAPTLVAFDYESTWIKEITFDKSLTELLYQLEHDTDVMGKRWAMSELVTLGKKPATSVDDKAKIAAGLRQQALATNYWRVKLNAIAQLQNLLTAGSKQEALQLDETTTSMLLSVIKNDTAWTRAQAVGFLALTKDVRYADLYIGLLNDKSHVVSYAAGTALGQTRSPKAFGALTALMKVPSWKGENVLTGLNGLKALGDQRATAIGMKALTDQQSPRWFLGLSRWDTRIAAAELLASLGQNSAAYDVVSQRFKKSVAEEDVNDMFSNVLLMVTLGDARTAQVLAMLKEKFKDDANAVAAVAAYEGQLTIALKRP